MGENGRGQLRRAGLAETESVLSKYLVYQRVIRWHRKIDSPRDGAKIVGAGRISIGSINVKSQTRVRGRGGGELVDPWYAPAVESFGSLAIYLLQLEQMVA